MKFFYNGIKGSDGKLQKCSFSDGLLINFPAGTITIYADSYRGFYGDVADAFEIQNNSDSQTDYFERDRIRVTPNHPLYDQVKVALDKKKAHWNAVQAKREAKWAKCRI